MDEQVSNSLTWMVDLPRLNHTAVSRTKSDHLHHLHSSYVRHIHEI